MKIEFNWKKFSETRPEVEAAIIFKYKGDLYFGSYTGFSSNGFQYFLGGKLRLKSLSKKNNQSFCIPVDEANEITWDVYESEWV